MSEASKYRIRLAVTADAKALVELCHDHALFEKSGYDKTGKQQQLEQALEDPDHPLTIYVAEEPEQQELVGYMSYTKEYSTWNLRFYLHMDCLYLSKKVRRQGLGKKLIEQMTSDARKMAIKEIQWQTPFDNEDAILFYYKLGAGMKEKCRFFLST